MRLLMEKITLTKMLTVPRKFLAEILANELQNWNWKDRHGLFIKKIIHSPHFIDSN